MSLMRALLFLTAIAIALPASAADKAMTKDKMSWLDNGQIRLGVDLSIGGAITYLADASKKVNMINSHDWGRQIQMSFYSGPVPFVPPGAKVHDRWKQLGWNPIQVGDVYGNRSRIIEHSNDGKTIHVKCIPMHWPLKNVPGKCTFECWFKLEGCAVKVTSRLNNARADKTQYPGRSQELPAVYTNGPWYKLVTYLGDKPFTAAEMTTIQDITDNKGWPWRRFMPTENWAALLDKNDHGLGVWMPESYRFIGGFAGKKGKGGPKDGPTGYLSPLHKEILDHNIVYTYDYTLVVGSLRDIRDYVYKHSPRPTPPVWRFTNDRQHWTYARTTDAGWPIRDGLRVKLADTRTSMVSPPTIWQADKAPKLYIRAALKSPAKTAAAAFLPFCPQDAKDWANWGKGPKPPARPVVSVTFPINGDGKMRTYEIDMSANKQYRGAITQLRLLLPAGKGLARIAHIGFAEPK